MKTSSVTTNPAQPSRGPKGLSDYLADAARDWNLPQKKVLLISLLPFIVALIGASTALLGKSAYKAFTGEDGIAETFQVIFYVASFVMSSMVTIGYWRRGERMLSFLYLIFTLGLFFLIGEELSWGQRIFGWQTSDSYASINKQEETNLHNVYGVGSTFKWVQMLVGAYGTLMPLILLRWKNASIFPRQIGAIVPHYSLIGYFALLFVWRIFRNFVEPPQDFYFVVSEYNEVLELTLSMGFFFFLLFYIRKLRVR